MLIDVTWLGTFYDRGVITFGLTAGTIRVMASEARTGAEKLGR
jgi:hypothetical protein